MIFTVEYFTLTTSFPFFERDTSFPIILFFEEIFIFPNHNDIYGYNKLLVLFLQFFFLKNTKLNY